MPNSEKEFLFLLGWDDFFKSQDPDVDSISVVPARVICEERNLYRVQTGSSKTLLAAISGKLQFNAKLRVDYPAVGDWVMVELSETSERGVIHSISPRKTMLCRTQAGTGTDMQILSTNIDYVFVTTSVNEDLNYRRLERYITLAQEAGAVPVILLTKADKSTKDILEVVAGIQNEFPDIQVHALSRDDFEKAEFLREYLKPGKTAVFIGSSGVGKSTLVNYLIGHEQVKTQDLRENVMKGRHTTTSRNLYHSRFGGLIIDTPGMRELQLSDHAEGIKTQFADVVELIQACRFSDCKHQTEPGCAIKAAMVSGSLTADRWQNYQKLEAEVQLGIQKQDKALVIEEAKKWKKLKQNVRGKVRANKDDFE